MKVFSAPIPAPAYDYRKVGDWQKKDDEYRQLLTAKLRALGYNGAKTGKIIHFPIADGHAQYMLAHKGRSAALVHMNVGDAWQISAAHARGLTYKDVMGLIEREGSFQKLFASHKSA